MKSNILLFGIIVFFFAAINCGSQQEEFADRKFIIASKKTIKIKELDLSITNDGCGREWVGEMEKPYCDLKIKFKDSIFSGGRSFKPIRFRNIEIEVDQMNPWGKEEDSIPPGGCSVWIRQIIK